MTTKTTINTIEDLIRILDDNPEWLEALRQRLLTRELLEMPNTLARFIETTNRRFEEVDQRFGEANQRFDRIERDMRGILVDLGILKGYHALDKTVERYDLIADDLGLSATRVLPALEIRRMARDLRETGEISRSQYESFRDADMIIEAEDAQGERSYIAVEASFTIDDRDTRRAIRNAGYVARATGASALASVSGVEIDNRVQELVDSDEVHWHRLPRRLMEPS